MRSDPFKFGLSDRKSHAGDHFVENRQGWLLHQTAFIFRQIQAMNKI